MEAFLPVLNRSNTFKNYWNLSNKSVKKNFFPFLKKKKNSEKHTLIQSKVRILQATKGVHPRALLR